MQTGCMGVAGDAAKYGKYGMGMKNLVSRPVAPRRHRLSDEAQPHPSVSSTSLAVVVSRMTTNRTTVRARPR
jgi:hypothetical protein